MPNLDRIRFLVAGARRAMFAVWMSLTRVTHTNAR